MTTRIKLRRDTATNWETANTILATGEPGLETDTRKIKYGDGTTPWNLLSYSNGVNIGPNGQITVGNGVTDEGGSNSIAMGTDAGIGQAWSTVAIGNNAGNSGQGPSSIAIGRSAGTEQGWDGIAIGRYAGNGSQDDGAIAIGYYTGYTGQHPNAVAVGSEAGRTNQSWVATAVGRMAGNYNQGPGAVAVGHLAGQASQSNHATAVGRGAGNSDQGTGGVAVGANCGWVGQGDDAVAVGTNAGDSYQQSEAVAIGAYAAEGRSGDANDFGQIDVTFVSGDGAPTMVVDNAADIRSGMTIYGTGFSGVDVLSANTVTNEITLSANASEQPVGSYYLIGQQGQNSIAIGARAAQFVQHPNSIVINSTGNELPSVGSNTLVIKSIRSVSSTDGFHPCYYNPTTGELVYYVA